MVLQRLKEAVAKLAQLRTLTDDISHARSLCKFSILDWHKHIDRIITNIINKDQDREMADDLDQAGQMIEMQADDKLVEPSLADSAATDDGISAQSEASNAQ